MKIGMIAFSQTGLELGDRLFSYFKNRGDAANLSRCEKGGLENWSRTHFSQEDALIFLGSCGIAVRAIAPFVQSKITDPAVVVIDEGGNFVIPLLSGHLGGANELAASLSDFLGAAAVITTATDVHGLFAVDAWAKKQGLFIANPEKIKEVSSKLLAEDTLLLKSDYPVEGLLPKGLTLSESCSKSCPKGHNDTHILISHKTGENNEALHLIPPVLVLGLGCKKNTPSKAIEQAFSLLLERSRCHPAAVNQVCTIDLKAEEPGLLEFCQNRSLPLRTFTAAELNALPGAFTSSDFVKSVTGVDNVCERCALLGSSQPPDDPKCKTASDGHFNDRQGQFCQLQFGRLIAGKTSLNGVTTALALKPYTLKMENITK